MLEASASHILVETEEVCLDLKEQIEGGLDFAAAAAEFSACPSGAQGGSLGTFSPGQMVPEFDKVVDEASQGAWIHFVSRADNSGHHRLI